MTERLLAVSIRTGYPPDVILGLIRGVEGVYDVHEVPVKPAHEVLAEAVEVAEFAARVQEDMVTSQDASDDDLLSAHDRDMAQHDRDLAAQLRAMDVGPQAEDYEAAMREEEEYCKTVGIGETARTFCRDIRERALELARERSNPDGD